MLIALELQCLIVVLILIDKLTKIELIEHVWQTGCVRCALCVYEIRPFRVAQEFSMAFRRWAREEERSRKMFVTWIVEALVHVLRTVLTSTYLGSSSSSIWIHVCRRRSPHRWLLFHLTYYGTTGIFRRFYRSSKIKSGIDPITTHIHIVDRVHNT